MKNKLFSFISYLIVVNEMGGGGKGKDSHLLRLLRKLIIDVG